MLKFKSRKGEVAALLTLGLVLVGSLITLGVSFLTNNNKIASNPRATTTYSCCKTYGIDLYECKNTGKSKVLNMGNGYVSTCSANGYVDCSSISGAPTTSGAYACVNLSGTGPVGPSGNGGSGTPLCQFTDKPTCVNRCETDDNKDGTCNGGPCGECISTGCGIYDPTGQKLQTWKCDSWSSPAPPQSSCPYVSLSTCQSDCEGILGGTCDKTGCSVVSGNQQYKCISGNGGGGNSGGGTTGNCAATSSNGVPCPNLACCFYKDNKATVYAKAKARVNNDMSTPCTTEAYGDAYGAESWGYCNDDGSGYGGGGNSGGGSGSGGGTSGTISSSACIKASSSNECIPKSASLQGESYNETCQGLGMKGYSSLSCGLTDYICCTRDSLGQSTVEPLSHESSTCNSKFPNRGFAETPICYSQFTNPVNYWKSSTCIGQYFSEQSILAYCTSKMPNAADATSIPAGCTPTTCDQLPSDILAKFGSKKPIKGKVVSYKGNNYFGDGICHGDFKESLDTAELTAYCTTGGTGTGPGPVTDPANLVCSTEMTECPGQPGVGVYLKGTDMYTKAGCPLTSLSGTYSEESFNNYCNQQHYSVNDPSLINNMATNTCSAPATTINFADKCSFIETSGLQPCSSEVPSLSDPAKQCYVYRICGASDGSPCRYDCYTGNSVDTKYACGGANDVNTGYDYVRIINNRSDVSEVIVQNVLITKHSVGPNSDSVIPGPFRLKKGETVSFDLNSIGFSCDALSLNSIEANAIDPSGKSIGSGSDGCGGGVKILISLK